MFYLCLGLKHDAALAYFAKFPQAAQSSLVARQLPNTLPTPPIPPILFIAKLLYSVVEQLFSDGFRLYGVPSLFTLPSIMDVCVWSSSLWNKLPEKEWQLHTFLNRFSNSQTHQIERLISESRCPQPGHSNKARKLIQKWLRYKRRNGVAINPDIEQLLWSVGKGSRPRSWKKSEVEKQTEEAEEVEAMEVFEPKIEVFSQVSKYYFMLSATKSIPFAGWNPW